MLTIVYYTVGNKVEEDGFRRIGMKRVKLAILASWKCSQKIYSSKNVAQINDINTKSIIFGQKSETNSKSSIESCFISILAASNLDTVVSCFKPCEVECQFIPELNVATIFGSTHFREFQEDE